MNFHLFFHAKSSEKLWPRACSRTHADTRWPLSQNAKQYFVCVVCVCLFFLRYSLRSSHAIIHRSDLVSISPCTRCHGHWFSIHLDSAIIFFFFFLCVYKIYRSMHLNRTEWCLSVSAKTSFCWISCSNIEVINSVSMSSRFHGKNMAESWFKWIFRRYE